LNASVSSLNHAAAPGRSKPRRSSQRCPRGSRHRVFGGGTPGDEGNLFFVEEVLKSLIEKGSVRREHGRWKKDETNKLVIPQSVKEAIAIV
jgi:hypothetical protein